MTYDPTQGNSDLYFQADLQDNVSPTADQIEKRLKALGASKTEIKMFLTAYDQATPKIKQAHEMVNKLPKQHMINVQTNADQAQKHLERLREVAKAPINIVVKVKDNVDDYIRSFKDKFRRLEVDMRQQVQHMPITAALVGVGGQAASMAAGPLGAFTGVPVGGLMAGGAGGAAAIGGFFAESLKLNSSMQQSVMQLTQLLRSPSAAGSEYKSVQKFSNTTPFNMSDVLATDIMLRNQGINPSNKTIGLRGAGNLAAATGVPLSQASGAISSANLGYFQSLNNITGMNIRQSDFTYGGRESGKTYQQALAQILSRYTGALQDQTQTFKGLATNIQDAIQQKVIAPAGTALFGAAGGLEKRIASTVTSDPWQLKMSRETDKLNMGMTKLFTLVQQGSTYFKNSLEVPLKSVGNSIIQVGTAFAKTFGNTTLDGIKYLSQAFSTLLVPLGKMAAIKLPVVGNVGGIMGFMKALHMFGISTNTGMKDFFGGLAHLDLSRTLAGFREFSSLIAKVGFFLTARGIMDFKNSTDQLTNSFRSFGKNGGDALDHMKLKFDSLIFKANMLGKSVSDVQGYGAEGLNAIGVNPRADKHGNVASAIALTAGMNAAKMSTFLGSGPSVSAANSAWYKAMNLGDKIYGGHMSPNQASAAVTDVDRQIVQASHALANALGVSLPKALQMTVAGLQGFYAELKGAHALNPAGAGLASALQYKFAHGGETAADFGRFGTGPAGVVKDLLTQTYAPGASTIASAMHRGALNQSWGFLSDHPNATGGGAPTVASRNVLSVLASNAGIASSGANINTRMQQRFGSMVPGLQLPTFQNPLAAAGYPNLSRSEVLSANPQQQARQLLAFADAGARAQTKLQSVNKEITDLNNTLQQYSVIQSQAAAAQASFDLRTLPMQQHIQKMQDRMTAFTLMALNPLQRAMNAVSQSMANYQQRNIVPVQRAQDVWNQTMLMTSNRLSDVSNSLRVAQYNMQLYSQGMLVGENAAQKNIESLNIYSEKLRALQLLNNGLQQDITRKQVHGGFSSTVAPMSGFSLAREQQVASNRAQLAQIQYDTTYGLQHWQLQRAARTIFQSRELPFSQRMRGTFAAAAAQSGGEIATFALQNLQYQQSLKSRALEEQMYTAQKGTWGLADKQFALNQQMFHVQQKMSLDSDKIAKAQLGLQVRSEKIQWNTQKINDLVQIAENGPKGIQNKLYGKEALAGALQTVVGDINNIEGGLIKNFDNNVRKGNDALTRHLPEVARDMHASRQMLHDIIGLIGGGNGKGGGGSLQPSQTSGGLGSGGSLPDKVWNLIRGTLLSPLTTLITAANAASNFAHQFTGSGTLGTVAGIGLGVGGGLFGLNAARIGAGQFMGRAVLPGAGRLISHGTDEGWRASLGGFISRRGETAVEGAGGHGLDIIKSLLRPMGYIYAKLGQLGAITAVSGAVGAVVPGGHAIGLPLGWVAGEQMEASIQRRSVNSRLFPVARSVLSGRALGDMKGIIMEAFGGTTAKGKGAYDKVAKLADTLAPDNKTLRTVNIDPSRAGVPDGWKPFSNTPTSTSTRSMRTTTAGGEKSPLSSPGERAAADEMKAAAGTERTASGRLGKAVEEMRTRVANVLAKAAESETGTALKNTKTATEAKNAAEVLKGGSHTFRELVKGKFAGLIEDFGSHVSKYGKISALIVGGAELIKHAGTVFKDAGTVFKDAGAVFSAAAQDIGKVFSSFGDWVKTNLLDKVPNKVPKAGDVGKHLGDAEEAARLNEDASKSPMLRAALQKAAKAGGKVISIGGKVFSIAAKGLGALSFAPAAIDAVEGKFGQAALSAAKAGEYFVPGVGEAKVLQDLVGLLGIKPGGPAGRHGGIPNMPGVTGIGKAPLDSVIGKIFAGIVGGDGGVQVPSISAMKALSAQWRGLSKQEQQQFYAMSKQQQLAAYQDALSGPKGLDNYLDSYSGKMHTGYKNQMTIQQAALVIQGKRLADHLNDVQSAFGEHWTTVGSITSSGFSSVAGLSSKYLQHLSKQIHDWGKANGLHISENVKVVPGNLNFGGAQVLNGSTVVINRAHGGLVEADKHRVGMDRGRMVRMVEEGHPEVVIPLAPHRRDRAKSLVKHAAGMIGMADGGYVFPFPKGESFSWQRVDQGQDLQGPAGGPVLAIAPGIVSKASDKFSGFGPFYATEQITGGPLKGRGVYYGHTKVARTGPVSAGDIIAYTQTRPNAWTAAPAGWLELGFLPYGSMSAGAAIAPILHALAKGGNFSGGLGLGALGGNAASHLQLGNAPNALKQMGIIGPKVHAALRVLAHKVQSHYNKIGSAGAGMTGMLGTGGIAPGSWTKVATELAKKMGWGPSEVNSWRKLEGYEDASFSLTATNPSSGAYGLAQMLGATSGVGPAKAKYYSYGGNPNTLVGQLTAMANYMKQRYGTPTGALAHELATTPHWYAGGLPRVARDGTLAMLHQGETVLSAAQTNSGAAQSNSESLKVLKQISDNTGGTNTYLGKQLAIQEQAYIAGLKATGPTGKGTGNIAGHLINTAGHNASRIHSPFGSASDQESRLITSLISSLHNTPVTETIAKAGKAHAYTLNTKTNKLVESAKKMPDAKALAIDEKTLGKINKKIDEVKDAMKHEKKGSKAYEDNAKLLALLQGDAREIRRHIAEISTTLHMSLAKALELRKVDTKAVQVDKEQIARLEKALHGHHLSTGERKKDEKELKIDKHKLVVDSKTLRTLNKALDPALEKWIKMEEKRGVSKKAIDLAIKHVGDGDNQGILSNKQLDAMGQIGKAGKHASGTTGSRHHAGSSTGKHHQKGHALSKEAKSIDKNTKEGAKHGGKISSTVAKHLAVASKHLSTSAKHLAVSNKHLATANKHLGVTSKQIGTLTKHLGVSTKHLAVAGKHFEVSKSTDKTASKHLATSANQLKNLEKALATQMKHATTAEKHLNATTENGKTHSKHLQVATGHAASAAKHLQLSSGHYGKAEKGQDDASKDRKGARQDNSEAHKEAGRFHNDTNQHQQRVERHFTNMVNHLSNVVNRLDRLNPTVQNNITIAIGSQTVARATSVGSGSVRTR